jgi:hypothetical protein
MTSDNQSNDIDSADEEDSESYSELNPLSSLKSLARKSTLILLGLCIAYCIVDIFVILNKPQSISLNAPTLNRGAFTNPGPHRNVSREFDVEVKVNKNGFVDKEWGAKWSTQKRILLLGDSFVQGAQVELSEGIGRQLELKLNEMKYDSDVISIGVPGAGTTTAFELLKKYSVPLQPDIVVLAFLVSNDIMNNHYLLETKEDKVFYLLEEDQLILKQYVRPVNMNIFWRYSHTYRYVYRELKKREESQRKIDRGNGIPIDLYVHAENDDQIWEEAWSLTSRIILEMEKHCLQNNMEFKIVLIPTELQLSPQKIRDTKAKWKGTEEWNMDTYALTRAYVSFLSDTTPILNLYKGFKNHPSPSKLYYPADGHWNSEGHLLAASLLADWITETDKSFNRKRNVSDVTPNDSEKDVQVSKELDVETNENAKNKTVSPPKSIETDTKNDENKSPAEKTTNPSNN